MTNHRKYCPNPLIENSIEHGYTNELAVFMLLKRHLSHGWFRNLSGAYARLPKRVRNKRLSYATFTRAVRRLREEGLIEKDNKVYRLLPRRILRAKYKSQLSNTIIVRKYDGVKDCRYSLLHKIKERMARQQLYRISTRKLNEIDDKRKRLDKPRHDTTMDVAVFTHQHIADRLNLSKSESVRLNQFAVKRHLCRSRKLFDPILFVGSHSRFKQHKEHLASEYGYVFYRLGYAVRIIGLEFIPKYYWNVSRKRKRQVPSSLNEN